MTTFVAIVKRIPWIVWALLAPAVVIGAVQLWTGGAQRVVVVGAGIIAMIRAEDAPEGVRYDLEVKEREPHRETVARAEESLRGWPDIVVFALDAARIQTEEDAHAACTKLATLARHAHNATAVPVLVSFTAHQAASERSRGAIEVANACWRDEICAAGRRRLCLDLTPHASSARAVRQALATAVLDAQGLHEAWRASTQVGR